MIIVIINLLILSSISLLFYKASSDNSLRPFFWSALLFKVFCGLCLGLLYQTYYSKSNDTFFYFDMASEFVHQAQNNPWTFFKLLFYNQQPAKAVLLPLYEQPRALIFVKFLAPVNFLTQNSYWLSSIYFSLFSFYGCYTLANFFTEKFNINRQSSALAFLFFPSFVFWSSGIMKESVTLGLFGIIIPSTLTILSSKYSILKILLFLISAWLLWQLKYYFAAVLIPFLLAYISFKKFEHVSIGLKVTLGVIVLAVIAGISILHPNLNFNYFPKALFDNYSQTLNLSATPDYIFKNFEPTWLSILWNSPKALITGLFRPFLWECELNFQLLAGMENLFLLAMSFTALSSVIISKEWPKPQELYFMVGYVIVISILLAFASPNFGTLLRYKSGFMPFFILLITHNNPAFCYLSSNLRYRSDRSERSDR